MLQIKVDVLLFQIFYSATNSEKAFGLNDITAAKDAGKY